MRLIFRLFLIGSLFLIASFILVAVRHTSNIALKGIHSSEDETVFRLLASAPDAPELSTGVAGTHRRPQPEITFNLAIVLVVSLLSVALLITGICFIIVIAIAMDSSTRGQTYNSCELKRAENGLSSSRRDMNFDYESEEEFSNALYSTPLIEWPNTVVNRILYTTLANLSHACLRML